jgi:tRNA (mo5U34)-methyltransferase
MDPFVRFSALVRQGLRFRRRFEEAKQGIGGLAWYPYDCFANLFYLQRLLRGAGLSLEEMADERTVLDVGAADGALSFFFESLGFAVNAIDSSGTNMNRMEGIRRLAEGFHSKIRIADVDIDRKFCLEGTHGLALFLGTLYHLKNPYAVLETLAEHAQFCFLSTRVARWSPGRLVRMDEAPLAYLLDRAECNEDSTNYWIFSPPGLVRVVERSGWEVLGSAYAGSADSDPSSPMGDERAFLLLRSRVYSTGYTQQREANEQRR